MDFSNFNLLTRCFTNFNNDYKDLNKIMLIIKYGNNTTSTTNITNKPIVQLYKLTIMKILIYLIIMI